MLHFHISEQISQLKNSKEFTYFHHINHPMFIDVPYISIDSIHFSQPFLPGVAPPVVAHPDVPPGLPIQRSPESSGSCSCCRPRSISGRWGEASAVPRMVTVDGHYRWSLNMHYIHVDSMAFSYLPVTDSKLLVIWSNLDTYAPWACDFYQAWEVIFWTNGGKCW